MVRPQVMKGNGASSSDEGQWCVLKGLRATVHPQAINGNGVMKGNRVVRKGHGGFYGKSELTKLTKSHMNQLFINHEVVTFPLTFLFLPSCQFWPLLAPSFPLLAPFP